jgi:hypothetical protein
MPTWQGSHPFLSDDEEGESAGDDEERGRDEGGEPDRGQPEGESPTVTIGEESLPLADVQAALDVKRRLGDVLTGDWAGQDPAEVTKLGLVHAGMLDQFGQGVDGALQVFGAIAGMLVEQYGEELPDVDEAPLDFTQLDPELMTTTERGLYAACRAQAEQTRMAKETLAQLRGQAEGTEKELARFRNMESYADLVRGKFPGSKVDGATVLKMMAEQGVDDPVKAYILATHDDQVRTAAKKAYADGQKPRPDYPAGAEAPRVTDKMTVSEEAAYYRQQALGRRRRLGR